MPHALDDYECFTTRQTQGCKKLASGEGLKVRSTNNELEGKTLSVQPNKVAKIYGDGTKSEIFNSKPVAVSEY